MGFPDIIRKINEKVAQNLGESIEYRFESGSGQAPTSGILIRQPAEVGGDLAFEFRPTLDVPTSEMDPPADGDTVIGETGDRWMVDSWDELEGMYQMSLRKLND